jgi:hypothetical protein
MTSSYPNPWDFSNKDRNLISPDGQFRVEYGELFEIAMGAPVGGECFLVYPDNSKLKLSDWAGGPVVWETQGRRVAFPVWTRARDQKIAVVDIETHMLSIYSETFRVLDLKAFENNIIRGQDSPIHMTIQIEFDTSKQKVEKVKQLK